MMKLILLYTLAATTAFAEEAQPTSIPEHSSGFEVQVNPSVYRPSEFAKPGTVVKKLPPQGNHPGSLPSRATREAVFQRVPELSEKIAAMDELDRDLLFMRAKANPLKELKKFYPNINEKQLARLKSEIKKR